MVNQQALQGHWNEIKGKLRNKWGKLADDDLLRFNGNVDELIGTIQRKTGEARDSIEKFLNQLTAEGGSAVSQAAESVRTYAGQAADMAGHAGEAVQEASRQAAEKFRDGYADAEEFVRQRPAESLAVCFGAGLVAGLVVGLLLRSR